MLRFLVMLVFTEVGLSRNTLNAFPVNRLGKDERPYFFRPEVAERIGSILRGNFIELQESIHIEEQMAGFRRLDLAQIQQIRNRIADGRLSSLIEGATLGELKASLLLSTYHLRTYANRGVLRKESKPEYLERIYMSIDEILRPVAETDGRTRWVSAMVGGGLGDELLYYLVEAASSCRMVSDQMSLLPFSQKRRFQLTHLEANVKNVAEFLSVYLRMVYINNEGTEFLIGAEVAESIFQINRLVSASHHGELGFPDAHMLVASSLANLYLAQRISSKQTSELGEKFIINFVGRAPFGFSASKFFAGLWHDRQSAKLYRHVEYAWQKVLASIATSPEQLGQIASKLEPRKSKQLREAVEQVRFDGSLPWMQHFCQSLFGGGHPVTNGG